MEPSFEQACAFLDQALLNYAADQIEAAAQCMAKANAVLQQIQLAPAEPEAEPAAIIPEAFELPAVAIFEAPLALPSAVPVTAAMQPASVESARESSRAVAA